MTETGQWANELGREIRDARAYLQAGQWQDAERLSRQVLAADRGNADALQLLGQIAETINRPEAFFSFGNILKELGRLQEAELGYRRALALKPDYVEALNNRGIVLAELGWLDDAANSYRQALAIRPEHASACNNLANILRELGRHEEAERLYRRTLALKPELPEAWIHHGNALLDLGRLEEAEHSYRRAVEIAPNLASARSNLLMLLNYLPERDPRSTHGEAMEFGKRIGRLVAQREHRRAGGESRKLRVGYLTGDFRIHSVAFFMEPVLAAHDRSAFEIFCYHNFPRADTVTARLKAHADHWRDVYAMDDTVLADHIAADAIDILVDLSGHTANNRVGVFARKPAPIQVTYLGYPATTGLAAIDYRLTDAVTDPAGRGDDLYVERLVRLPHTMWCFGADQAFAAAGPLPCSEGGSVTFGSFNYFAKLNPDVIALWSRLLGRLQGSRLIVTRLPGEETANALRRSFESSGISPERIELYGILPREQLADLFARVDIALDPFPYAGTTTTCEVLWMGIPVVTKAGASSASRSGASLLQAVGLQTLVAHSAAQYLEVAESLARDTGRLAGLRSSLRERMRSSSLMDSASFTRDLEEAYRQMWRAWSQGARA